MDQRPLKRSRLGSILATAGGILGVLGVIAMRIGLKATLTPDTRNVVLIREVLSTGGLVVFGLAVALIVGGALVGRRAAKEKNEGSVRASAQTDPGLIPDFPPEPPISTYASSEKQPSDSSSSGSA